ncbi:TetR/AcrR family transcriptional regulator [Actinomadura flavalba]|uniref:TetR/AcrR family transcriptional regulator n=1 Tax=Actinomadura flavalba TaxID=1120938 RepID=UPI00035D88F7|nr:TetR/AcrR family transcriptional regulator [Actinomadura flavalba]
MGRPAKFSRDDILDAALALTAESGLGAVTMAAIAARLNAPTGSLYHRYASRDLLLAALWIRGVQRFQRGFLDALNADDAPAAALHTPRWCRRHPDEARFLLLHRRRDLVTAWPAELGPDLDRLDRAVEDALTSFIARHQGTDPETLCYAVIDAPYGAVRRHLLADRPPPPAVDALITATYRALSLPTP